MITGPVNKIEKRNGCLVVRVERQLHYRGMTTVFQKSLLGLSVFMAIVLVAVMTSKKFTLEARRNALLLEMVANISTDLDKLDNGFDSIASRAEAAKGQLRRLAAIHRDNLMICALLHEKHKKSIAKTAENTGEIEH